MKREKKIYPRHVRALRTAAIALAMLLYCHSILHFGFLLLPTQTLHVLKQLTGVYERTQVVQRRLESGMTHLIDVLYLTEGENSLSLFCTHPGLFGWTDAFLWPVDTSDGGDVHAGVVTMSRRNREGLVVFYGRVKGTEGVRLTANVCTELRLDAEHSEHVHVYGHGVGEEYRRVRDGCTYFIFIEPYPVPEEELREYPPAYQLIVNRGEEHTAYEIEQTASVFWG